MSKLISLSPKGNSPLQIRSKGATKAEIVIYGAIGQSFWEEGITAKAFSDEMKKLDASVKEIDIRLNSPGGDVFDGIAIYNRLKQHPAKVTVYIDGLAASIASVIALAGDEVKIGEGALYMIHLPWTFAYGNRKELDTTIDRLMDVEEQLISIYAKKTKLSRAEIRDMLEKETWMDASQAKEMKFVDQTIGQEMPIAASLLNKSWFKAAPKNAATDTALAKSKVTEFKKQVEDFLARPKKV
jgi:ATP-dependent Clp protease protease subunit